MTFHGDFTKTEPKAKRRRLVSIEKRRFPVDCEVGDVLEFPSGEVFILTAWLNGGPMGRPLSADGEIGELRSIDAESPIVRLRGLR